MIVQTEITEADLKEAVREWLEKRGFGTTDRFNVSVKTYAGDRPFDSEYTTITLTGVAVLAPVKGEAQ